MSRQRSRQESDRAQRWFTKVDAAEAPDQHMLDTFMLWVRNHSGIDVDLDAPGQAPLLFDLYREQYLDWLWYEQLENVMPRTFEQWFKVRGKAFGFKDIEDARRWGREG